MSKSKSVADRRQAGSISTPIRILYMEDDPGLARLFKKRLERSGYTVDIARDGEEGLRKCAAGSYDILTVDQAMPGYNGLEVIRILASRGSLPPTIMVTGDGNEQIAVEAMKLGALDYIIKDTGGGYLELLPTVIERALNQQRTLEEKHRAETESTRLAAVIEQAAESVVITNLDGDIVYVNSCFEQTTGYNASEVMGQNPRILKSGHRDRAFYEELWNTITSGGTWKGVFINKRKDGSLYHEEATVFPVRAPSGDIVNYAAVKRDITERMLAEQTLQRHNAQLAARNAVAQALSSSLELHDILDEALSRTIQALGFTGGLVALSDTQSIVDIAPPDAERRVEHASGAVDQDREDLVLFSHLNLPVPLVKRLETEGLRGTLCDYVYQHREPLSVTDLDGDAPVDVDGLLETGLRSYAGAPIVHQGRCLGTFCLFDTEPHPVSESDHDLLTAIGQQIGVAAESARLFRGVAREREVAQTLLDTAEALSTTLRLDELLERSLDELGHMVPYDLAAICLRPVLRELRSRERPMSCQIVASRDMRAGPSQGFASKDLPPRTQKLMGRVVEERGPVIVSDVREGLDWPSNEESGQVCSWLGLPLISRDEVIGALLVGSHKPNMYNQETARPAFTFAHQVAMAIENSRLYEQTRTQLREATLLHDVTMALSSTLDPDQLLPYVARSLCEILTCTSVKIISVNADLGPHARTDARSMSAMPNASDKTDIATVIAQYAAPEATEEERRSKVGQAQALPDFSITTKHLLQRRPSQVRRDDPTADPSERARLEARGAHALLLLPMVSRGRVLGFAQVWDSQGPRHFTEGEIKTGQTLIHQATIALENSRLFQAEREQRELTEALYQFAQSLIAYESPRELLQAVTDSVAEALPADRVTLVTLDPEAQTDAADADRGRRRQTVGHTVGGRRSGATSGASHFAKSGPGADQVVDVSYDELWDGLSGWVLRELKPALSPKGSPDPREGPQAQRRRAETNCGAIIVVPLRYRGKTMGTLTAINRPDEKDFTQQDVELMTTMANQAAIAIENARLFEESQRRVRELRLLHDTALAAASGIHLEETLQAAAEALTAEMEDTCVTLMLQEPESAVLQVLAQVGYPPHIVENMHLRIGEGIIGWVAAHNEPVLVPDVRLDPRYVSISPNTRSKLCVPLAAGPQVIGVLNIESPHPNAFTEDDQRLLSTLANNLAVLIERIRLFEEVEAARAELQERAEALTEANIRLQELDRLKDQFLANMSHELRTPLNSVIGFSEVLLDGLVGDMPPKQQECVRDIHTSGEHLLALINDILDLSKIEAGRMTLTPTTFEVAELLAEVRTTTAPLIERKAQIFTIELSEDLPSLTADRFRIKQVLLNLLSNAQKFTPKKGHITLSCRLADPATMLFSVADTGIGIKQENRDIIFEEFRQADGSATREITGTGLGLAISKRLVEMHEGRIWVESEYRHGSTFSFLLPLAGPTETEPAPPEVTALPTKDKPVLLIAEDRQFSNLLALYLHQEGYRPLQNHDGANAVEQARELGPAFIILDTTLPDRSGWDLLLALKSAPQTKDIPMVAITASQDSEQAFSMGAADYLVKPVRREDLQALLRRVKAPKSQGQGFTVLVIDDDPDFVPLLREMIQSEPRTEGTTGCMSGRTTDVRDFHDVRLLPAGDGGKGLALARNEHPDAILLDLMLPGPSGFKVLEELRTDAETVDIPVTVLTAKVVSGEERGLLEGHVQGLMQKITLTPQALRTELRRLRALASNRAGD